MRSASGSTRSKARALAAVEGQPGERRLRVTLAHDGRLEATQAALAPLRGPVRVLLAEKPLAGPRPLAGHKTTDRAWQDAAVRDCEAEGAFDSLCFDAGGALLEGARSNVFVRLAGRWFTPPLSAGVLPGVMRAALLDDPAWAASERRITREELAQAEEIVVCNALRGAMRAELAVRHGAAA